MQGDSAGNLGAASATRGGPAPLLISLPRGMLVSGITTWAVRLANALSAAGRGVGLIVHQASAGHEAVCPIIHPGVRVFDCTGLPDLDEAAGDLSPFMPAYAHAVRTLAGAARRPVVLSPNHLGDCYGIAAALCLSDPGLVRVVGYEHLLVPYDTHVLAHYEPVIARFVGVSDAIVRTLRETLPERVGDVRSIPYGVSVPEAPATRPVLEPGSGRALRLIYTGRMEHDQKRVGALLELSRAMSTRGISHRITLLGDGPAAAEIDETCRELDGGRSVVRLAPVGPDQVARLLDEHDVFVLASRAEGLSVSLLEAMARGCVPVVTRTPSGTAQAITTGENGVIVDAPIDADDATVGRLLCTGVERALGIGLPALSIAAWATVKQRFSLEASVALTEQLIEECAATPARAWPSDRPVAFTSGSGGGSAGSGAVPPDGAARLRDLLLRLAGRSIVIHGTGRHTLELAGVLARSPARVLAFTDDDPKRQGQVLWNWPVLAPAEAGKTGATDVVVSSWMNQEAIWERRVVYERQGLAVHRVYEPR